MGQQIFRLDPEQWSQKRLSLWFLHVHPSKHPWINKLWARAQLLYPAVHQDQRGPVLLHPAKSAADTPWKWNQSFLRGTSCCTSNECNIECPILHSPMSEECNYQLVIHGQTFWHMPNPKAYVFKLKNSLNCLQGSQDHKHQHWPFKQFISNTSNFSFGILRFAGLYFQAHFVGVCLFRLPKVNRMLLLCILRCKCESRTVTLPCCCKYIQNSLNDSWRYLHYISLLHE